jgi:hypothetical protein
MTGELQVREDTPVVYLSGEPTHWLASGSSRLAIHKKLNAFGFDGRRSRAVHHIGSAD